MTNKTRRKTLPPRLLAAFLLMLALACFTSCSVTRTVTTEQAFTQRGDTAVTISTKTVETYHAKKQLSNF